MAVAKANRPLVTPYLATKLNTEKTPLESARAGAEDDSLMIDTVIDPGTDLTMSRENMLVEATSSDVSGKERQVCVCGWQKVTNLKGLRIHQGRKRCLVERTQGPRIDNYFLRSTSSQSGEVQRQEVTHSSQDISTPDVEVGPSTEADREASQPKREKISGQKPRVKWPGAAESRKWEDINSDLVRVLGKLKGSAESKLEKMGDLIYDYGKERFGVFEKRKKVEGEVVRSRRQQEIDRLIQERRQLKRQWRKATEVEKEGIDCLQADVKERLAVLRRAENIRKNRKKKERARIAFYKDPFRFVKSLFSKEKNGSLMEPKQKLEEYLEEVHKDRERFREMTLPSDIPPIGELDSQCDDSPPRWKEVEEVVRRAKASSAPGPNGVPYRLYKSAPDVLRFLWKLMKVVWKKQVIPKAWRRAGGIFIPKERDSLEISQFRPISLLNVEGKVFFSVVAQRLSSYLEKNRLIDTSVQKAGIPGFSGCLEHTSMIWHQIQSARREKRDLHVVFLDLANAFGSVPHSLLWEAFDFFRVPGSIKSLVKAYFLDIQLCFTTAEYTTAWQQLEIGIMAGCTISPLAFTMAMEVIIRASKWVVGGERLQGGLRLPPIRAYMDDMTTMTPTAPCTSRLLDKLNSNLQWARMKVKPSKSRSISIVKGKVVGKKFVINDEVVPTVLEKPVKSLGRWYDASLSDKGQFEELRQEMIQGISSIDKSGLPGKLKLWCLQFGLLPRLMWPLTVYEVPVSKVEKLERMINSFIRKWLGVPRCLSSAALYGKGILELPVSSLTEEFKCAKVRLEMTLTQSKDPVVRSVAPTVKTGRKWNPKEAVQLAQAALRHRDIIGQVQHGRGGLGLCVGKPVWNKASVVEKRKMVVEEVHRQEEAVRCTKAVSQAKQGQWVNWESVEKRKLKWRELWSMEASRIRFIIGATYDVLPSPQNLNQWLGEDSACPLCSSVCTLRHILSGCKVSLSQGRYTWRHNQVLKCLAAAVEEKRLEVNSLATSKETRQITFVREGEKVRPTRLRHNVGQLSVGGAWEMRADLNEQLVIPAYIVSTRLRPDLLLWSEVEKIVYFIELTVPWEDRVEEAYERKKARYAEMAAEAEQRGWRARVRPVEVGCRGFVAKSVIALLTELGIRGRCLKLAVSNMSLAAERASEWLWLRRKHPSWGAR